jgi:acetyl-CoA carboxylase biotin carboxyl carrier protein
MSDSEAGSGDVFEVDRIRNLVELMKEFDLREIDLRQASQRIRLCRGAEASTPVPPNNPATVAHVAPAPAAPQVSDSPTRPPETDLGHIAYVKSPMVGTFYTRANPNVEPYVNVGDHVEPDTTVCIIEAMKVFNEIPAELRGRIVAILAEDEEPVEYGKPLFKVDTSV